jgi:hypothetical protein
MTDDELRLRLHRADPAASVAPAAPDQVARLMEETMTVAPTRTRVAPGRWIAVAAAVVLIAAGGVYFLRPGTPTATPGIGTALPPASAPVVTRLTVTARPAAKCMAPTPEKLKSAADFAFAGTVLEVAGEKVTLEVTRVYTGAPAGLVEVSQTGQTSEQLLGGDDKYQPGERYLIASAQGEVMFCGYTGPADNAQVQDVYQKAF